MIKNLAKLSLDNGGTISPSIIPGEYIDGTGLCNSSIFIDNNGDILLNLRHVHYLLYHDEFKQQYWSGWGCLAYLNPEDDVSLTTGNYLCKLNPDTLYIEDAIKLGGSKIKHNASFVSEITPWIVITMKDRLYFHNRETKSEYVEYNLSPASIKHIGGVNYEYFFAKVKVH